LLWRAPLILLILHYDNFVFDGRRIPFDVFYNAPLSFNATGTTIIMTQDELKKAVGWAALQYVQPGTIVGVGTGSTARTLSMRWAP
jgi:hypothetical protein